MNNTSFIESERRRYANTKPQSSYLSDAARADGIYKKLPRAFCLPAESAKENLFTPIRTGALTYFAAAAIPWHDGHKGMPSNHLCSSQVCCVNFLFPFIDQPEALAELLRPLFPTLQRILPIQGDEYVAFEWIGAEDYLGERRGRSGLRTRGANATSADAAVRFQLEDERIQVALIEWKYTESYAVENKTIAKSGTDRREIYRHLWEREDFPLDNTILTSFDALFYEPFYQLFRQQCLANEMERAHELDADLVSTLHIAPAHNRDFLRVTSPELWTLGTNALEVWKQLVRQPDRFRSVTTEGLFSVFPVVMHPQLQAWWDYITLRYPPLMDQQWA